VTLNPAWWLALLLLALCTVHSKIAGVLWGLGFLFAAWLNFRRRPSPIQDAVTRAAKTWLLSCALALAIWVFCAAQFNEVFRPESSELNVGMRLVVGALAAGWLVKRLKTRSPDHALVAIDAALTVGCIIALLMALSLERIDYPSNAIPWSAGIAFWMILLAGAALRQSASRREQVLCAVGVLISMAALLVSRTRGAYPAVIWPLALLLLYGSDTIRQRIRPRVLVASALVACTLTVASAQWESDPLRLRAAISDIKAAWQEGDFNTTVGVRVYLTKLGWQIIVESPWVGIGAAERKLRIASAGLGEGSGIEQATYKVRDLGHAHNGYLHHAIDGGMLGLSAFLLTIAGLVVMGRQLRNAHPSSAHQLYGLAFVHAVTNLSNVNFAHNYYVLMLAISVGVVLVQARLATLRDH